MPWRVEFEATARKELDAIDAKMRGRIIHALETLAVDPYHAANVKALAGSSLFRLRVGDYRVIYALRNDVLVILVVRVAHRRDVYR